LLDQAFAHCPIFPTAASRRSLGRVSVPVWLIILSDQLPIIALVGHYPTNKLIGRRLLHRRLAPLTRGYHAVLAPVSRRYPPPVDRFLRVTHPSATAGLPRPCDLHVLSMPPAFALSQDQTLRFISSPDAHPRMRTQAINEQDPTHLPRCHGGSNAEFSKRSSLRSLRTHRQTSEEYPGNRVQITRSAAIPRPPCTRHDLGTPSTYPFQVQIHLSKSETRTLRDLPLWQAPIALVESTSQRRPRVLQEPRQRCKHRVAR
jgi:hypothetical protein